jgi:phenylalanyl-tRNA synthetase beta chain
MRFSVNWLKKWVDIDLEAHDLAERLTDSGLEVDTVQPVAAEFSGVVVGEILDCGPHPDADKLKLCRISDGRDEPLQVVCGAPNARAGLKIPFARIGAVLGGDFKIRKAKLRGMESFGMACSARELGLSEDHSGLMELPADAAVGKDFRDYLGLDDHSIEVELTPNRADCLSIRGIARDVVASCRANSTPLEIQPVPAGINDRFEVRLDAPVDCARYAGRVIRGINPTVSSPLWMVEALRRSGLRSISPTVDATNYVLMELGQPTHAFDLDTLQGSIHVRRGREGEKLVQLDGKTADLDDSILAICDDNGPVALAGIMGGLDTGVTDNTRNIFLESAWFKPATISGKARSLGLHTDASHRFERGVDPQGQVEAIERITALLLDMVGGEAGPVIVAEAPEHLPQPQTVGLRLSRINRVLGSDLDADTVSDILTRLGMQTEFADDSWNVTAPSSRYDIEIEEDLIEEVARIHGYNNLPAALPSGELRPGIVSEKMVPQQRLWELLCTSGYQEVINYSFVDRRLLKTLKMDDNVLPLANPLSADMDVMRTALLPGLLTSLSRNLRRQQDRVRLFETGHVFHQRENLVEPRHIAAVVCGSALPEQWGDERREVDYFDIKGDLEQLMALRGDITDIEFVAGGPQWLHPGQGARVYIGGREAGCLGAVHPAILSELNIRQSVYCFEMDLAVVLEREVPFAKTISRFPSVRRDLALLVPEQVSWSQIRDSVIGSAGELLANLRVFDVFQGKNVEKGYKSIAIGLILQNVSCTLIDEAVDSVIRDVVSGLQEQLGAQLRG